MALREAIKERDSQREADGIIQASAAARAQKTQNIQDLLTIQGAWPDGIPAVLANKNTFIDVSNKLIMMDDLNLKLSTYKARLIALKAEVNDTTFISDIQAEIDLI